MGCNCSVGGRRDPATGRPTSNVCARPQMKKDRGERSVLGMGAPATPGPRHRHHLEAGTWSGRRHE